MTRQIRETLAGSQSGMSLIEVLASMVVLSLGVLGLAPMMAISIDGSVHSDSVTNIVAAAQEEIEQRLANGVVGPMPLSEVTLYHDGRYTLTTQIADATVDGSIPDHVYKVDVTVDWQDNNGVSRSMGFVTYAAKP